MNMRIFKSIIKVGVLLISLRGYAGVNEEFTLYKKEGKVIMDMILSKEVDITKVKKASFAMADAAAKITKAYIEKYPSGKKLLESAINELAKLKNASFNILEKDWHDLGYFSGKDIGVDMNDEDNEHFTDPLHCMIHPLLTLRAAEAYNTEKKDKDLQTMKEELREGLEQMEMVFDKLK